MRREGICRASGAHFALSLEDLRFYERVGVPPPQLSPRERFRRRLAWRNERHLYRRTCPITGSLFLSIYSEHKPYQVYSREAWWSDDWDQYSAGREYDFSRPFLEQFNDLLHVAPLSPLIAVNNENSEYVNFESDEKNCYMNFGGHFNQDCYHNTYSLWGKDCVDNYWVFRCELVYGCVNCFQCYGSAYLENCHECVNCYLSYDLRGCKNCIGCIGLRHKEYYLWNQPCSKQDYQLFKQSLESRSGQQKLAQTAQELFRSHPRIAVNQRNCLDCSGDYLSNSKNCLDCFQIEDSEDSRYLYIAASVSNCYDLNSVGFAELSYEVTSSGFELNNVRFCAAVLHSHDLSYCYNVFNSHDLFGCVGLRQAEYCILNKKYSRAEYQQLVGEIIDQMKQTGEWGEFFPMAMSPFPYHDAVAMEYFPLEKNLVAAQTPEREMSPPDCVAETTESVASVIFTCRQCQSPYRVIAQELRFHRNNQLALSENCPQCRHLGRIRQQNQRELYDRICPSCKRAIVTTYSPSTELTVLCSACYERSYC